MKIETMQELDIANTLMQSAVRLAQVSEDPETKSQCTRCASIAIEAMSAYLGGAKE